MDEQPETRSDAADDHGVPPWGSRLRSDAALILADTLRALDPAALVAESLSDHMDVMGWSAALARRPVPGRTVLVSVGKGGLRMAKGALDVLGRSFDEGIILVPETEAAERPDWLPAHIRLRGGGHPLPTRAGEEAAREIASLVSGLTAEDRLLTLISGGGSALLSMPAHGLSVDDLAAVTRLLLESGLSIREINVVRRRIEVLKGGGLARLSAPAEVLGLVLSDVAGDDPSVVASGPLSPAPGTPREAEILLRRTELWDQLPSTVQEWLHQNREGEPNDTDTPDVRLSVIGGGQNAAREAMAAARRRGYTPSLLSDELSGEARRAGRGLARAGAAVRDGLVPLPRPACLVATGETTVTVLGNGKGGRNQEVALGAAQYLRGSRDVLVSSLGTDGIDGPTDAAGAWADGATENRAASLGLSVDDALERNDAYPLLAALGDLVITGATGTNVADLMLVLVAAE